MQSDTQIIPQTFLLTVYDPQGTLFSGSVYGLSTGNELGPLSIISGHANFISLISQPLTIYSNPRMIEPTTIPLDLGVVRVFNNVVQIFVGMGLDGQPLPPTEESRTGSSDDRASASSAPPSAKTTTGATSPGGQPLPAKESSPR